MDERASLPGLPLEIMEFVVEHMVESECEGSLAALALTCRSLHALIIPRLYNKQMVDKHPALIFWVALLGRFSTAKRLVDAGVDLNRGMIRNETMAHLKMRLTRDVTPCQIYQDFRVINNSIAPHDTVARVGTRGYISQTFRPPANPIPFPHAWWRCYWFPLHLAVMGGFSDLVELFISNGAILDVPSGSLCLCGNTSMVAPTRMVPPGERPPWKPLHTAICFGHTEIAKTLLKRGAIRTATPYTVLHDAARAGNAELINFVLDNEYQTNVDVVDAIELSPLWHAVLRSNWSAVDALLARGADINDDLADGYTPLMDVCFFGDFGHALELISRGADVNVICMSYPTHFNIYRWPVKENLESLRGQRPIDLLCLKQQCLIRSMRYIRPPAPPRFNNRMRMGPPLPPPMEPSIRTLPVSDEDKRGEVVRALLDAGAGLHACRDSPFVVPPLVAAAAEHLVDVVRLLLDSGADVNCVDKEGNTPLMAAINYSLHWCPSHAKVGPLSSRPFGLQRPNRVTVGGVVPPNNPRSCRETGDFTSCVKLLVEHGANTMATNAKGASPLSLLYSHTASSGRRYKSDRPRALLSFRDRATILPILLAAGADPHTVIEIVSPEDSNSDVHSDSPNAYSSTDSDSSLDTPRSSDWSSRAGPERRYNRRRYRSLYKFGPLSLLQCAFWDGDLEVCRSLIKDGAELSIPVVAWMLFVAFGYCRNRMAFAAQPVLQILGDLEVDVQRKLACHPACLYVLIEQRESGIVDEILQAGIEREKFDETPGKAFEWMSGDARHQSVTWGSACLAEAAAAGWLSTVETLLQLGIDVNAPDVQALAVGYTPLNLAIKADNSEMVELLLRSGAHVKIFDDGEPVFSRGNKIYPLVNAIARENENIMRAILSEQKEPLPVSSAYAYIRYAYMTRSPKSLACLVTFDCLQPNVTSPDEGNTHLIEIIKNISAICTVARERYFDSDSDSDDDSVSWSLSIRTKLARVRIWVECLILLARARISPTVKNHAGVSALDLFDGLLNYEGPDRFKKHVRSALRSRLNDVMGEKVAMNFLPPDTTFEALKLCEVDLAESVSGTSDSE